MEMKMAKNFMRMSMYATSAVVMIRISILTRLTFTTGRSVKCLQHAGNASKF